MKINASRRAVRSAVKSVLFISFALAAQGYAQSSQETRQSPSENAASEPKKNADENSEKLKQLEAQVNLMQEQLEALKSAIAALKGDEPKAEAARASAPTAAPEKAESAGSKQAPAQTKPDLGVNVGSARLTPYGSIYFNAFGNSGGTNNADVPLFATSTGRGNTGASLRQTRLGVRLEGAKVGEAKLNAILEADFFGGFPSIGIGENFGVVRLRLANVRLDWEKTSLTLGQDWSVFAPVSPTSLATAAIPQMAAAGNNWARLPQVRVDHKAGKYFLIQGAVAAPQTGDSATNAPFFLQPNSGSTSRMPFFEARAAVANVSPFGTKKTATIGFSGHYGRSRVYTGAANTRYEIDSFGVALDWNLPLHERLIIAGEAFVGRNLAGFQGGIFQGYNTEFAYRNGAVVTAAGVRGIGTHGGWTQLGFTPDAFKDRLSLYASLGIDDPRNEDLVTFVSRDLKKRNLAYAFDLIYKFTPQFSIGAEFRRFQTDWTLTGRQRSNHVNLGAVYSF
ncbi:MAG: hypothetical protein QUS14_03980 [Pyrinomonadaceae bacterium]|nr:hypothetical protein [Pyrinomonadaceae bacterium]